MCTLPRTIIPMEGQGLGLPESFNKLAFWCGFGLRAKGFGMDLFALRVLGGVFCCCTVPVESVRLKALNP